MAPACSSEIYDNRARRPFTGLLQVQGLSAHYQNRTCLCAGDGVTACRQQWQVKAQSQLGRASFVSRTRREQRHFHLFSLIEQRVWQKASDLTTSENRLQAAAILLDRFHVQMSTTKMIGSISMHTAEMTVQTDIDRCPHKTGGLL